MNVSRRRFLTVAGGAAGGAVAAPLLWSRLISDTVAERAVRPVHADRVLVVVECGGGNDGLNTLVPTDGRYRDARPALAVPEGDLLTLAGEPGFGLHPALEPLAPHWEAGTLACFEGIGLEGQSRSHFQATDTWGRGTAQSATTGWLGRWLDATAEDPDPLRALALGGRTQTLAAAHSLSTLVRAPATFGLPPVRGIDPEVLTAAFLATAEPLSADPLVAQVQQATPAAVEAVRVLAEAMDGPATEIERPGATALLDAAANVVELGVGTQVVVIGLSGFDTHAGQGEQHAGLLADVAGGIAAFLDRMAGREVLVVTTSEFGRRVAENASGGTDHGYAGVQFATGPRVNGGIVGDADLAHLVTGDLPLAIDTRSLYAVALDWLGGPTDEILDGSWDRYGVV